MYICDKCGEVFEEPVTKGEPGERCDECPACGNEYFDEAVQCRICGEWVAESNTKGGYKHEVCFDCINKRKKDIDFLLRATKGYTTSIEIPDLFASVLDEDEIREIVNTALHKRVLEGLLRDSYPWHDPANDEIVTDDFLRYYGNEIAEALCDEEGVA